MGKGYNNFMSKKAFHPGSYANQKRIHEAEAKTEAKRKHDEETLAQYQKEQELFNQKSLVSRQSKEKLSLSFMYEAPPGIEKPEEKQSDKVEWKGQGTSGNIHGNGLTAHSSSKTNESTQVCLEWRRDKKVNKKTMPEVKHELEVKREIKTELKDEPQIDLKWKREVPLTKIKEENRHDTKRIKKER